MLRNSGLTAHQLVTPRRAYSLQSPAALMQHQGSSVLYEASINFCTRRTSEVEKGTTRNRCANCFNLASLFPANELHGSTAASSRSWRVSETRGAACNLPLCHCPNTVTIVMEVTYSIQWQTYQLINAILMDLWHIKYTLLNSANIDIVFSSHDPKLAPRGIHASEHLSAEKEVENVY